VLEAYRRDEISRVKLAELAVMVDLSRQNFDRLVDNAGLHGTDTGPFLEP
jgi:hypothetical protein